VRFLHSFSTLTAARPLVDEGGSDVLGRPESLPSLSGGRSTRLAAKIIPPVAIAGGNSVLLEVRTLTAQFSLRQIALTLHPRPEPAPGVPATLAQCIHASSVFTEWTAK
jgi:hypothetical protein